MRSARRGIILPVVLGVLITLALLSALAMHDAVLESRVSSLSGDQLIARAAAVEGLEWLTDPPDLASLCLRPPLVEEIVVRGAAGGGTVRLRWRHLGAGLVVGDLDGRGRLGASHRIRAHLVPDTAERLGPLYACPAARRLVPAGPSWLTSVPEG